MKYRYQPKKNRFKKIENIQASDSGEDLDLILEKLRRIANSRAAIATVFIIVAIFALYSGSKAVTGYFAYQESLEQELNQTKQNLTNSEALRALCNQNLESCNNAKTTCMNDLSKNKELLSTCEDKRDEYKRKWNDCKDDLDNVKDDLNECEDKRDKYKENWNSCESEKDDLQDNYNSLKNNYIRDKCCTGYSGQTIYWKLDNQKILCATNQTSGYSSYNCP
ncbi:MAG: hypothetical protein J7K31_03065 [Candidatus Aenigmarchaeota archaeon]|nr:hypothetical protein [Candidatus Aenigmarchaeota archaeon]